VNVAPLRYLPRAEEFERMTSRSIRENFLVDDLFETGSIRVVPTDLDRLAVGGAVPQSEMPLAAVPAFGTSYFTERREVGIFNIGDPGVVRVGTSSFRLGTLDCLYVGVGEPDIIFGPGDSGVPVFYLLTCPAHEKHPTRKMARNQATSEALGGEHSASRRCLHKYIHPEGLRSCQLVMGFTELAPGSVWNTMPPHTHDRRSEIYMYFDLGEDVVFHMLGKPESTRHVIVRDRQAVLSPPWSVHAGAGTHSYRFIWGMAGENQAFHDMNRVALTELR
jgi:4-deoxy-L-threo-5-hexosulose-uronate ketol-isomerase